jgi:hypothetical protein
MRNLILSTLLVGSVWTLPAQTNNSLSLQEAIDRSAHQEVLTQCIAKAYLCSSLDLQKAEQETLLAQSIQLFDYQLKQLKAQSYSSAIRTQLRAVEQLWASYKFICQGAYSANNALLIVEFNTEIKNACQRTTQLIQQHANNDLDYQEQTAYTPNTTLLEKRRTLLMQRMALYAVAYQHKIGNHEETQAAYAQAAEQFTRLLNKQPPGTYAPSTIAYEASLRIFMKEQAPANQAEALIAHIATADALLFPLEDLLSQQESMRKE